MLQARTRPFLISQWDGPAGVWGALSSAAPHSLDQEAASRSASTTQPPALPASSGWLSIFPVYL